MTVHYYILVASKFRFGFSISTPKEVMGVCPDLNEHSCQQQSVPHRQQPAARAFGPLQPGKKTPFILNYSNGANVTSTT